jgi:hypothetical protein
MPDLTIDTSEMNVIFVHSKIDDLGLSMAAFRIYGHLARRAGGGLAYPGIDSMAAICRCAKNTVVAAVRELEARCMIVANRIKGKGTTYRLTKSSEWTREETTTPAKEITEPRKIDNATPANGVTKGNPSEDNPKKEIPDVVSMDGFFFADWFQKLLPSDFKLQGNWRTLWAKTYDDMVRIDQRTKQQIAAACKWARQDEFWRKNFFSPVKLRQKKDGIQYFDIFTSRHNAAAPNRPAPVPPGKARPYMAKSSI